MGEHERRRLLPKLSGVVGEEVERLLRYPDHTAGGIMTTEFVRLDPGMTVGEALKHIRSVAREKESIFSCYVMEPETGRLLGSVSLRDLVMSELSQLVPAVMRRKPITVAALDDQELVAQKIAKYNLLAVPVVETDGRMVGFVTVDDVIDVLTEEATEDVLKMAAVNPDAGGRSYFDYPLHAIVRNRVGWLLLLFVAGTFTSGVLRHYEGELAAAVALSFFIPLLIGTGGNAGSQAVMTVIRSLALGEIGHRHAWRVVAKEATVGLLLGALIGSVAFVAARFWGAAPQIAVCVALAMVAICVWSTTVGSLIPIAAQRLGVDPAVLSAPLISTLVDATGLVIYFEIARAVLRL
jgi:magnesium transporter